MRTYEYAGIGDRCQTPVANPVEPVYDADGNLIEDDRFGYTFDDENHFISRPITLVEYLRCALWQ